MPKLIILILLFIGAVCYEATHGPRLVLLYFLLVVPMMFARRSGGRLRDTIDNRLFGECGTRRRAKVMGWSTTPLVLVGLAAMIFLTWSWNRVHRQMDAQKNSAEASQARQEVREREQARFLQNQAVEMLQKAPREEDSEKRTELLESAVQKLRESVKIAKSKENLLPLAETLVLLKRYDEGQEVFAEYAAMDGRRITVVEQLRAAGENERALASVELLLKMRKPCDAQVLKGLLLLDLGRENEAVRIYYAVRDSCKEADEDSEFGKRMAAWEKAR